MTEYTASGYVDLLTDIILQQHTDKPPVYGQSVHISMTHHDLVQMMDETRHDWYGHVTRAVASAVETMYLARKCSGDKQCELKTRMLPSWTRWLESMLKAMPPIIVEIPTDYIQPVRLSEVSAHDHQEQLIATDVTVIGVDSQQVITTHVRTGEKGWIPVEQYQGVNADGVIIEKRYADVQTILAEEYSDQARPGLARRLAIRVRIPHVGTYTHGDHLRVYGYYRAVEDDERKVVKRVFFDVIHVFELPKESDAILAADELAAMRHHAMTDPQGYITALAKSVAPDILGNEPQKIVALLAACKGQIHGDSRSNLHVVFMDSPGSGKSELLKWLSPVIPKATYIDAPNATAQGLLYGQEDYDGRKVLHAGPALRYDMLMIDEMDKMPSQERKKMNSALEQQVASYTKVPFMVEHRLDLSMIAAANPHGERWREDAPISENTRSLEPALLSRCIISRMEPMNNVDTLVDAITGDPASNGKPRYTSRQIAGMLAHCRKQAPGFTASSRKSLKKYLGSFRALQQHAYGDLPIDTRKEMDVIRLSGAAAKLLHRTTVDDDSIQLGIRIYQECLASIGMQTEAPTVELKLAAEPKDMLFWDIFEDIKDEDGRVREVELIKNMTDSGQWPDDARAQRYVSIMHERHHQIYSPSTGWFKRVV